MSPFCNPLTYNGFCRCKRNVSHPILYFVMNIVLALKKYFAYVHKKTVARGAATHTAMPSSPSCTKDEIMKTNLCALVLNTRYSTVELFNA